MQDAKPTTPDPSTAIRLMLIAGAASAALGLGFALEEVASHRYLELSFTRTAYTIVRDQVTLAAVSGIAAALLLALLGRLRPRGMRPAWGFALGSVAGLTLLATLVLIRGAVEGPVVAWVVIGTVLVSFVLATRERWSARPLLRAALLSMATSATVLSAPALALGLSGRYYYSFTEVVIRNATWIVAALLAFVPLFVIHHRGAARAPSRAAIAGWTGVAVLLPLALWLVGPLVPGPSLTAANPRNVVLIGIDTLRADRTTLLGPAADGRSLTPNLAALAQRGLVFDAAVSQSSWTLPSFASIMTGKYPQEHGALYLTASLREAEVTLPEILREAGYATGAVVSHFYVNERRGFGQGYEFFREHSDPEVESAVSSAGVTDLALEFVAQQGDRPFFLFAHYFDPHAEYVDHPEWTFADAYPGWLRDEPRGIYELRSKRHLLGPEEIAFVRDLYDEEIAHTDAHIGRLIDDLDRRGLLGETAIIVVADHGEEFLERGWIGHTITLNEEVVRVPLMLYLPGVEQRGLVDTAVETRALFATVLDYLGIDFAEIHGRSLLPAARGEAAGEPVYSSVWLPRGLSDIGKNVLLSSVHHAGWKLISDHIRRRDFLYDLAADPGETRNLVDEQPEKMAELLELLDGWVEEMQATGVATPRVETNDELRDKLRALGYL